MKVLTFTNGYFKHGNIGVGRATERMMKQQSLKKLISHAEMRERMNGLIDIHCHILPGVDDGAETELDSLQMAEAAVEEGIHTIIATPHHKNGRYENDKQTIKKNVSNFNKLLDQSNLPLTVLAGQETRLNGEMTDDIANGELLPLNETKYVFVEFPTGHIPHYAKRVLFDMQMAAYKPIIVHPERNRTLMKHPNLLYDFVRSGALTQVTAASYVGKFGKNVQKRSHQFMEANLVHFIASDAHNTTTRRFSMKEACQQIERDFGYEERRLLIENSQLLVEGKNIHIFEPKKIKPKAFFGLF